MQRRRGGGVVVVAFALVFALGIPAPAGAVGGAVSERGDRQRFIVTLRDDVEPAAVADEHAARHGAAVAHVYRRALRGYAATLSARGLSALAADARVLRVEPDGAVSTTTTQNGATWGLDRIDQRAPTPTGTAAAFTYTNTGAGVKAYVIDTGVRRTHHDFGTRVVDGFDAVDGGPADDCNGHGTHVAGTVGGATYGVAKAVTIVPVRVLDCTGNGSWSGVIAGIDWVTAGHEAGTPAVANMSLGGGASASVDQAVRNSIAAGVTYAVAAGNGNAAGVAQDACKSSPARVAEAMTIGATDSADRKASWSNYGKCVDWFAPGVGITSAWHSSDAATHTIGGTSMATPHVAGVAALYLQGRPGAPPSGVRTALFDLTTKSVVTVSRSTNNHLLFTNL